LLIEAIVFGARLAIDLDRSLNRTAANLLPDKVFDVRFQGRIAFGQAQIELEVPIVDVRISTATDKPPSWRCASPWPVMLSSKAVNLRQ